MKRTTEEIAKLKAEKQKEREAAIQKLTATKSAAKQIIEKLTREGYRVEIEHTRPLAGFSAFVIDDDCGDDYHRDNILTRDEFNLAIANNMYESSLIGPIRYGDFVLPTGGFTRVALYQGDKVVTVGKYNFKSGENYFRSHGIVEALKKAGITVS